MGEADATLVIFDLCDTLVAENTTLGFLRLLGRDRPVIARRLERWTSRRSLAFYVGALAHRLGVDIARARMIRSLRGIAREELEAVAARYAKDVLSRAANAPVIERLEAQRSSGARVVIVSTSLDIVVTAVARLLDVEGVGSRLDWTSGRASGRLASDLTGKKVAVARVLAPQGWNRLVAFSDNATDRPLLAMADEGVLVVPKGRGTITRPAGVDDVLAL